MLPAHAGMVLQVFPRGTLPRNAPRARGDGPVVLYLSPRESQCSPRTRGWSDLRKRVAAYRQMLPAHAGMVPGVSLSSTS